MTPIPVITFSLWGYSRILPFKMEDTTMKLIHTLFITTFCLNAGGAHAEARVEERVLKDTTTMVSVALNNESVFCTARGYGSVQLKISVPELSHLAHFDHRVVGESVACITGGECTDTNKPGNIVDPARPLSLVPVRVILSEQLTIDDEAKSCERVLTELVKSTIREQNFTHFRNGEPTAENYEKCLQVLGQ
jgi:hypothetical protein